MPTDDEIRALELNAALARGQGGLARAIDRVLAARGLTRPQYDVLEHLASAGAQRLLEVGKHLGTAQGNVTVIVDNLARHGWVRRERDARDKRVQLASLTPEGAEKLEAVRPAFASTVSGLLEGLTPDEQEILTRLLLKLARGLDCR